MIPVSYDYEGAAAAIGVAVSKIKTLVREGQIAARYAGKDVLIERAELEAYVASLPSERPKA
jgi:excisionase family DNA binding protein